MQQRRAGELEGGRHALEDEVEGGLAVPDRLAEVAAQRAREEAAVLHEERVVEAHRLPELLDVLGASRRAAAGRARDRR